MSVRRFFKLEAAGGMVLLAAAFLAILANNSPLAPRYEKWFTTSFSLFWINEGLMTFFFLLIGLELKREWLSGEMQRQKALLPIIAAFGGMIVPACLYLWVNHGLPTMKGWSIPVATDIAFALGVLSLFGKRVPTELKVFLMALAIFDDIGAILIIAFFYTQTLSYFLLIVALGLVMVLYFLNLKNVLSYLILGFLLWIVILKSGVHATVAGVVLALMMPQSIASELEKKLHPWVAYGVMPLFAFANAGVSFYDIRLDFSDKMFAGILLGLFVGKPLGVLGFTGLLIKMGWAKLPKSITWLDFYGVACLCGIGFTMSLFLGTLAFQENGLTYLIHVRFGVLFGSILSGVLGAIILAFSFSKGRSKFGKPS